MRTLTLIVLLLVGGCAATPPDDAMRLSESTLEIRAIQTRTLMAPSETAVLIATIAVLQDMEFAIDEVEKPLGVITASKVADSDSAAEKTGLVVLDVLCVLSGSLECDNFGTAQDDQLITLTFVVLPSLARTGEFTARVTMQRVIFDKLDRVLGLESITEPAYYQDIFANLDKSLNIEVNNP